MLHQLAPMRDQIPNRVKILTQTSKPWFWLKQEYCPGALLMLLVFLLGLSL
jgi:hypothetical protein